MYADDIHGPGAVIRAVRELQAGNAVAFAICDRLPEGSGNPPVLRETIRFQGMPGAACLRYCGEDGKPDAGGSSTVHGCGSCDNAGSVADLDPTRLAATLGCILAGKSHWFFLLKEEVTA